MTHGTATACLLGPLTDRLRVRLPKDMTSMFSFKLLVSTGPKYKDFGCTENFDIEVDVIPPGKA